MADRNINLNVNLKGVSVSAKEFEDLAKVLGSVEGARLALAKGTIGGAPVLPPAPAPAEIPEVQPANKAPKVASKVGAIDELLGKGGGLGNLAGSLLGKVGLGAAAGPIGIALTAAAALTPVVKKLASAPFKAIETGMGSVNKALKGLLGGLGPIGSMLGAVGDIGASMKRFGDALGPVGIGLSVMGGAIEGITKQVSEFLNTAVALAAKAQPGVVRRFQIALDDAAAVIGHRMVPLVELMTEVVRGIGDILQTVLPSTKEFRAALAPLREAFADIKEALTPVAFILKDFLILGLKLLAEQLRLAALGVKILLAPLQGLARLTGMELESSVGAAARQVKFTNPESYAKEVYAAAAGSGADPAKQTASNTGNMVRLLEEIRDGIRALPGGEAAAAVGGTVGAAAAKAGAAAAHYLGFGEGSLIGGSV